MNLHFFKILQNQIFLVPINQHVSQLPNTCRAKEEQINYVKKTELSERSEFSVFSGLFTLIWESAGLEAVGRAFCLLFCGAKSMREGLRYVL